MAAAGLAEIYHSQNHDASAEPLYLTALRLWNDQGKAETTDTAAALFHLAEIYHARSKNDQAAPLYAHALTIWQNASQVEPRKLFPRG